MQRENIRDLFVAFLLVAAIALLLWPPQVPLSLGAVPPAYAAL